ncbi:hypothetical protein D9M72_590930 [compost metagenome]
MAHTELVVHVTPAVGRPWRPTTSAMARDQSMAWPSSQPITRWLMSMPTRKKVAIITAFIGTVAPTALPVPSR